MNQPVAFHVPPSPGAVGITHPTWTTLLADIEARLVTGEGFALATLNLDHIVKLRNDPAFREAYLAQTHVVADGNPVVWLSRLAGREVELVPGSELVLPLAGMAARAGVPVALLGTTASVLERAAARLVEVHPDLQVAARIAPPMGFESDGASGRAALDELRASGAKLCFLALGAPKQERLAARGLVECPGVGFVSIGAGLDFIADSQTRAPLWVRRIAMEWAWRMLSDPRRLAGRYAASFAVLPGLGIAAVRNRGR
jgi:exopolysaccharide biosynthesis WecB/TagA/CpsF family protein